VYLSITGEAFVAHDPDRAQALWNEKQKNLMGRSRRPQSASRARRAQAAETWDGPTSSAVAAFEFAKARLTGMQPDLGENRKVAVEMD
jgi:hypothetical protein